MAKPFFKEVSKPTRGKPQVKTRREAALTKGLSGGFRAGNPKAARRRQEEPGFPSGEGSQALGLLAFAQAWGRLGRPGTWPRELAWLFDA